MGTKKPRSYGRGVAVGVRARVRFGILSRLRWACLDNVDTDLGGFDVVWLLLVEGYTGERIRRGAVVQWEVIRLQ